MSQYSLTVFTPTYNREDLLPRGYEALLRQTSKDFCWLIIDDGSKDHTRELVEGWINEGRIPIKYVQKENGGLHTGYNKAIELMDTEVCVCIDSDDYMPDDGVEKMLSLWKECKDMRPDVAGVIGLDYYDGRDAAIGGLFAIDRQFAHIMDLGPKYHHVGDTKILCRVDLLKRFWPMPVFKGEKNFNPFYYYLQVDENHIFYVVNENFCNVDYQESGMSANIFNQYYNSPRSFACLREEIMRQKRLPLSLRFRNAIHYGSSLIFMGELKRLFTSPDPVLTLTAFPFSILVNLLVRFKRTK